MYKVNVEGTAALLRIAKESGTRSFVYTSSASVISDGRMDLKGADETFPLVTGDQQHEFYTHTKVSTMCWLQLSTSCVNRLTTIHQALAEINVLAQNRTPDATHFITCAIRPSGIFGIGNLIVLPGMFEAYVQGKTWVQLDQNHNLFDFTENTNVAHAHYLAAVALTKHHPRQIPDSERVDGEAFFITGLHSTCVAVRRGHHASRTSVDRPTAISKAAGSVQKRNLECIDNEEIRSSLFTSWG